MRSQLRAGSGNFTRRWGSLGGDPGRCVAPNSEGGMGSWGTACAVTWCYDLWCRPAARSRLQVFSSSRLTGHLAATPPPFQHILAYILALTAAPRGRQPLPLIPMRSCGALRTAKRNACRGLIKGARQNLAAWSFQGNSILVPTRRRSSPLLSTPRGPACTGARYDVRSMQPGEKKEGAKRVLYAGVRYV